MIHLHRENVSELQFTYTYKKKEVTAEKRKVFKLIFTQFKEAYHELNFFFIAKNINDIYSPNYLDKLKRNSLLKKRAIDLKSLAQVDIVYLIVFYGVGAQGIDTINDLCDGRYQPEFITSVLEFIRLKPKKESKYWRRWGMLAGAKNNMELFKEVLMLRKNKAHVPIPEFLNHVTLER